MKALVIAVYCGDLPALMPLWLRSAARNPGIDFLLVIDRPTALALPANVRTRQLDLAGLRALWSQRLGIAAELSHPYKLCDWKPLFWMLAEDLDAYDVWGFCDLDVIWGDLSPLLERAGRYAALLSEGHLRLFRNCADTRQLYASDRAGQRWQDVLASPAIFGFDEHHGINRALAGHPRLGWWTDPEQVADIDPGFRQLRRMARHRPPRHEAFVWDDGRIIGEHWAGGRRVRREYLYLHLQKRSLPVDPAAVQAAAFAIDPGGIVPHRAGAGSARAIAARNPWRFPTPAEARLIARAAWRRWRGAAEPIRPVDRPDPAAIG